MNKAQKEVQQSQLNSEKRTIQELKRVYKQARESCEEKIRQLSSRTDMENLQSIIYQKQYQDALKKQLDGIIDTLQENSFGTIEDYLGKSYMDGYIGVMYDLHNQGIPVITPINQEQVVKAIRTDSKISKGLYKRMGEDTDVLKKSIRNELSRGVANGSSWNEIAVNIANGMNSPFRRAYNRAIGIARTEGHRVQQASTYDAQKSAKGKGADVLKQWCATLDGVTRETHQKLDGQIREVDEDFEVNGMTAPYPGGFGDPAEDCNCRCCLLQRARWALDQDELETLKERATYFGLDKTDSFEDFEQKYVAVVEKNSVSSIINIDDTEEEKAMIKIQNLGRINTDVLEKEFGKIQTNEIIITNERISHIQERHPEDYALFEKYGRESVTSPDMVVKDIKHNGTVFMIKKLPDTNLNVVVRVVLETDESQLKNSVMTFYRIREKNLKKLIEKNGLLYKKE